jgi:hypothetical protein
MRAASVAETVTDGGVTTVAGVPVPDEHPASHETTKTKETGADTAETKRELNIMMTILHAIADTQTIRHHARVCLSGKPLS